MSAALDNSQVKFPPLRKAARDSRYKLRQNAAKILYGERVCTCGRKLVGSQASLVVGSDGGAYVSGIETCGSIWTCPVCAGKIAEGRRKEVETALDGHMRAGGQVYMMTLTVPHHAFSAARQLRTGVAEAFRWLISSSPWTRRKKAYDIAFIRSMEVTHGKNGWHPHLHVLLFTRELDDGEAADLENWLFERWLSALEKFKMGVPSRRAFQFELVEHQAQAGDYVAKWGVDSEIAKAHVKVSRKGGRSPWQILSDAGEGDPESIMLFREYAAAFKGARHLTWSRGLKDRYEVEERSDEDIANLEKPFSGDRVIGKFRRVVWHRMIAAGVVPEVLDAAENGGWPDVLKVLRERGLALPERMPIDG